MAVVGRGLRSAWSGWGCREGLGRVEGQGRDGWGDGMGGERRERGRLEERGLGEELERGEGPGLAVAEVA